VASLGEHLDIPVGEYTGTLEYGVSLYNLNYREINVPITIGYHSAGVKVSEEASEVGIGWALSAGGMISRTIRGQDDFGGPGGCDYSYNRGYYEDVVNWNKNLGYPKMGIGEGWEYTDRGNLFYQPYTSARDIVLGNFPEGLETVRDGVEYSIPADYLCMNAKPTDYADWESDLYSFHVGGYSGKFIITQSGEMKTIEASELVIKVHNATPQTLNINSETIWWSVLTPEGLTYVFGKDDNSKQWTYENTIEETWPENLNNQCQNEKKYISSWHLNKIITPRGEEVLFTYEHEDHNLVPVPKYQEFYENITGVAVTGNTCGVPFHTDELGFLDGYKYTRTATLTKHDDVKLKEIKTPFNDIVTFIYSAREDLRGGEKVDRVEIRRNNVLIKEWSFGYGYFGSGGGGAERTWFNSSAFNNHRIGTNNETLSFYSDQMGIGKEYKFEANFLDKRLKLTSLTELGNDGSGLPPYIFTYNETSGLLPPKHSFSVDAWGYPNNKNNNTLVPEWTVEYAGESIQIPGADRSVNTEGNGLGSLGSITLPTGGRKEIAYEPNQYTISGAEVIGGGYRVKLVKSYNENGSLSDFKEFIYMDENGVSTGKAFNNPNFAESLQLGGHFQRDCGPPPSNSYSINTLKRYSESISALSSYYRGAHVGYSAVRKLDGMGAAIGSVKSDYYNEINPRFEIPFMGSRFPKDYSLMNGKLVIQRIYDNKDQLVTETFYDYIRDFDGGTQDLQDRHWNYVVHYPPGSQTSSNPTGVSDDLLCDLAPNTGNLSGAYAVPHLYAYSDKFYRILPKSITTKTFDEENSNLFSTVTQSYKYIDGRTLLRSSTISGPGGSKVETNYYPEELGSEYQFMVDAHMTGIPVKVISSNGSTYKTVYSSLHFVPSKFTEIFSDNSEIATEITHFHLNGFPMKIKSDLSDFPVEYTWQQSQLVEKNTMTKLNPGRITLIVPY
ncbi:MAG: SpvB/TcaC N-terminal domain-containing protein, partial [Lewinella sp.]